ncbi:hypothetical protein F4859DRAFT_465984 [Xylaria cf. heliscus]|nr:hypothetical protein F4859DRAFT_465984 [Xylaria cf. heliscus]
MLNKLYLASLLALRAIGTPVERRDDTQPVGTNPITKFTTSFLGEQKSSNSCAGRDLGFTGELGGKWYGVYGDTSWCAPGVTDPDKNPSGFYGLVRDTVTLMGTNPLSIKDYHLNSDTPVPHPLQFVPFNASWGETNQFGFGGTSICETTSGVGAVYYLVNANDAGLKGAGVAKVQIVNSEPTVTQRFGSNGWWWNVTKTARYGDVAALRDPKSSYIYIWGGAPTTITDFIGSQYIYMARVNATDAFDLTKYQYWWGRSQGWKSTLLTTFTDDTAVFWGTGQGQIVWSSFYNVYIFVHLSGSNVVLRTATTLEGPWTPDVTVYTATPLAQGAYVYAGVAHPYLDTTGQTLTISYTNNANVIQVIKVTFSK